MIQKLSAYVQNYKKAVILAPTLCIAEVICELLLPLIMARIIDNGINGGFGTAYIAKLGSAMIVIAMISMICGILSAKFASIASQGFGANLRSAIFNHVQEFSFADIDRFSSASLITRMTNDVNTIQMTFNFGLRIVTRAPVMLITALLVCGTIDASLTLFLVGVIVVMAILIGFLMKTCSQLFAKFQTKIDGMNDAVQENLIAIRVVKAFVREEYEKKKFKKANDALTQAGIHAMGRVVFNQPIMLMALNAAVVGVLWMGGQKVMVGTMLVGDLSSFITYIAQILMSVIMVAMSLIMVTRSIACVKRIVEVLDTKPTLLDVPSGSEFDTAPAKGKVEFRDVAFKYAEKGTGENVLANINFTIEPGQFVAIIGGTGAGKSSLVQLIPRFYDVSQGQVLVDDMDVREYSFAHLRDRIGMVLQNNVLFSGTIRENLLWGKENATEEELIQATKDAQAYDFIMSLPNGFDTHMEQGGVNVSGGQKQRLCIARAMLKNPSILILDDSTSAVDTATEAAIRKSFQRNLKNTTVIMIAQRISSVQEADQIIVLEEAHIVGIGNHATLLQNNSVYREIYQSQQEGVGA